MVSDSKENLGVPCGSVALEETRDADQFQIKQGQLGAQIATHL